MVERQLEGDKVADLGLDNLMAALMLEIQGVQVETGTNITGSATTTTFLRKIWSERDVQIMVLISLGLQFFLLICGNHRRYGRVREWLRLMVWLSYLGTFAAATSGISLFSQYEDKYKIRSFNQSSEKNHTLTLPFLWVPFFLIHLGGQDTITAYSVEDNNLWLRLLLNLLFQLGLASYVFWKSFDLLKKLLPIAVPLFVAGIFKCGERIWALKSGSRDNLDYRTKEDQVKNHGLPPRSHVGATTGATTGAPRSHVGATTGVPPSHVGATTGAPPSHVGATTGAPPSRVGPPASRLETPPSFSRLFGANRNAAIGGNVVETYALKSTLGGRGLLIGRTLLKLGTQVAIQLVDCFADIEQTEGKLKIVLMELGMIYDVLYTKAMVLHSWKGRGLRCVALISMVAAFVLFLVYQHPHASNTANAVITYALLVVSMFMEFYSIFRLIVSPWTRAGSREGTCTSLFFRLSRKVCSGLSTPSMGQLNFTDYSWSKKSVPKWIAEVSNALGVEEHWRNIWHIEHVDGEMMINYILRFFNTVPTISAEPFQDLELGNGRQLQSLLSLPFEHALFRLHIFTDLHISDVLSGGGHPQNIKTLAEECRKLSNYLMYLMVVYPSMLPVSSGAKDFEPFFTEWVRDHHPGTLTKKDILDMYAAEKLDRQSFLPPLFQEGRASEASLKGLKEVWARLLIYAAGKCPAELHGRQLGEGVELLTVVWSLMMHHGVGEVGKQLNLLETGGPIRGHPLGTVDGFRPIVFPELPLCAFKFHDYNKVRLRSSEHSTEPTSGPDILTAWTPPAYQEFRQNNPRRRFMEIWHLGSSQRIGRRMKSTTMPAPVPRFSQTVQPPIPMYCPPAEAGSSSSRWGWLFQRPACMK